MTTRTDRRQTNPHRKTYSAYIDQRVIEALDRIVHLGAYSNRSEAMEEACRRLVLGYAQESVAVLEREPANAA